MGDDTADGGFAGPHKADEDQIAGPERVASSVFQAVSHFHNWVTHRSIHTLFANGIDKCGCSVKSRTRETWFKSRFLHANPLLHKRGRAHGVAKCRPSCVYW